MPSYKTRFCAYPSAFIHKDPNGKGVSNLVKHLFWGDTIRVKEPATHGWYEASSRDEKGWMRERDLQREALLDIIFLDVGQGDSCFIVTPKDERIILDAGPGDNLARYMRWRYKQFTTKAMRTMGGDIRAFILSHPDQDHYGGLHTLFDQQALGTAIRVGTFFHNGIFPRSGKTFDQAFDNKNVGQVNYLTSPIRTSQELKSFLTTNKSRLNEFSKLIADIQGRPGTIKFRMLHDRSSETEVVDNVDGLSIKILSPVLERDPHGAPLLRSFARKAGVCKNGNSVVMLLRYRDIRIFFSGDLNEQGEEFLLNRYQGKAGALTADVFKVPHHGSSDFLDVFLAAVNPAVSIVSSGDNEGYSHPRADTLGCLGRNGRGTRPLIFSTELARSPRIETLNMRRRKTAEASVETQGSTTADIEEAKDRIVAVYGAINLRSDGHKIVMCQKKEAPDGHGREWDIYCLEPAGGPGALSYVPQE